MPEARIRDSATKASSREPGKAGEAGGSRPSDVAITAVVAGSFDPITAGHVEIVSRAARMFSSVIVAVGRHPTKPGLFPVERRLELIAASLSEVSGAKLEVDAFEGLLTAYCSRVGASVVVRGLRGAADYEREAPMAHANRLLMPGLETIYLLPRAEFQYVSSSLVREIASFGGDVSGMVTPVVAEALARRYGESPSSGSGSGLGSGASASPVSSEGPVRER